MKRALALFLISAFALVLTSTPAAAVPARSDNAAVRVPLIALDPIAALAELVVSFFADTLAEPTGPPKLPPPVTNSGSCTDPDGRPIPCGG